MKSNKNVNREGGKKQEVLNPSAGSSSARTDQIAKKTHYKFFAIVVCCFVPKKKTYFLVLRLKDERIHAASNSWSIFTRTTLYNTRVDRGTTKTLCYYQL